jgi:NADP-dependent 3-hydroxy acid dehydrogenase YdfG
MTSNGLDNTVALVVGATSGIGKATALTLSERAAAVGLLGRRTDRLTAISDSIQRAGNESLPLPADVRSRTEMEQAVRDLISRYGRLDTVIFCAGIMRLGAVMSQSEPDISEMVQTNLLGLIHCCQIVIPHLANAATTSSRGVADLVSVSSVAATAPLRFRAVYGATKAAVSSFADSLRQELSQQYIRVSVLEPGAVDTDLPARLSVKERESLPHLFSSPSALQPEDVAEMICYLLDRRRTTAITKIVLRPTQQVR